MIRCSDLTFLSIYSGCDFLTQLNEILIGVKDNGVHHPYRHLLYHTHGRQDSGCIQGEEYRPMHAMPDLKKEYNKDNPFTQNKKENCKEQRHFSANLRRPSWGKAFLLKQQKPKRQFDDSNFRQLMQIASGKILLAGIHLFHHAGCQFLPAVSLICSMSTRELYTVPVSQMLPSHCVKLRILCVLAVLAAVLFVINMKRKRHTKDPDCTWS